MPETTRFGRGEAPAFPGNRGGGFDGMTLREYYAGQALIGILAADSVAPPPTETARLAVEAADALLAELAK